MMFLVHYLLKTIIFLHKEGVHTIWICIVIMSAICPNSLDFFKEQLFICDAQSYYRGMFSRYEAKLQKKQKELWKGIE